MRPSPRGRASLVAALVAGFLLLPWLAPVGPNAPLPAAQAAELSAVDRYGSCLAGQQEGDLLLVFDESQSLEKTDPEATRVAAATYLLQRLGAFSQSSGASIDVALAGFDQDFEETTPWTALTPEDLSEVTRDVAEYKNRNDGRDTDYWWALKGSRRLLAEHASKDPDGERCQAIAWFSDGKLDLDRPKFEEELDRYAADKPYLNNIDPRSDVTTPDHEMNPAEKQAQEAICRPKGLADQLRPSGVVTFGIGLTAGGTDPGEFGLMQSITTGEPTSDGKPCGEITSPTPGEFQYAANIEGLLRAFDALIPGPAVTEEAGVCQGEMCTEAHRFVLDSSIGAVHILGTVDVPVDAVLTFPSGTQVPLPAGGGTVNVEDIAISYAWLSPKSLEVDLTAPPPPASAWTGAWSLTFIDRSASSPSARSQTNIHISGNLFPSWPGKDSTVLYNGQKEHVTFAVVDGEGNEVDPTGILGTLRLTATLVDSTGKELVAPSAQDKDQIGSPVDFDLSDVPTGSAKMRLSLEVTTKDAEAPDGTRTPGTALKPQPASYDVRIANPPVDKGTLWLVFFAAMVLGVGIPLGIAYGAKYAMAKIPARALHARRIPVTVRSGQLLRDGVPFELRDDDLVSLVQIPDGGGRHVVADGVELRARTGRSPFGPGHVTARAPSMTAVSAAAAQDTGRDDGSALLPLAVHNNWVLLHDPTGAVDEAELLLLVGSDATPTRRADLVADARAQVPLVLGELRTNGRSAGETSASFAGSGGGRSGGGSPFDIDEPPAANRPTTSPFDFPDRGGGDT